MRHEAADPYVLVIATKPCRVCQEGSDREGGSALNLCNVKRIRAHREFIRRYEGPTVVEGNQP